MLARRSLSIILGSARWRLAPLFYLCFRCSRSSRLWRIRLAGVFLWAIASGFGGFGSLGERSSGYEPDAARPAIAADLDTIRERGALVVGVKDTLRPLGFRDASGQLQGFEIDLARRLAADLLGDPEAIVLVTLDNGERLGAVYDRVDVTIAQVGVTESRERLVQFSLPYWIDGTALVVPDRCGATGGRDCPGGDFASLATATIAVLRGSDAIAALQWQFPEAELTGVDSYRAALAALENGEIDAFAGDRSVAIGWTQTHPGYRVLPDYITARSLAIVLPKGMQYATLRAAVNDSVDTWRASGWLEDRLRTWGLTDAIGNVSGAAAGEAAGEVSGEVASEMAGEPSRERTDEITE